MRSAPATTRAHELRRWRYEIVPELRALAADPIVVSIEPVRIVGADGRVVVDGDRVADVDTIEIGIGSNAELRIARVALLRRDRRVDGGRPTEERYYEPETKRRAPNEKSHAVPPP